MDDQFIYRENSIRFLVKKLWVDLNFYDLRLDEDFFNLIVKIDTKISWKIYD